MQLLIDLGVSFDQDVNGNFKLTKEGGHSKARIFVKDRTGQAIIQTLLSHLSDHPNIEWINGSLESLHSNGERICGLCKSTIDICVKCCVSNGWFFWFIYEFTNPKGNIRQGIALAHKAGASDLEFVRFTLPYIVIQIFHHYCYLKPCAERCVFSKQKP